MVKKVINPIVPKKGKLRKVQKRPASNKSKLWKSIKYMREGAAASSRGQCKDQIKWKRTLSQLLKASEQRDHRHPHCRPTPPEMGRQVLPNLLQRCDQAATHWPRPSTQSSESPRHAGPGGALDGDLGLQRLQLAENQGLAAATLDDPSPLLPQDHRVLGDRQVPVVNGRGDVAFIERGLICLHVLRRLTICPARFPSPSAQHTPGASYRFSSPCPRWPYG